MVSERMNRKLNYSGNFTKPASKSSLSFIVPNSQIFKDFSVCLLLNIFSFLLLETLENMEFISYLCHYQNIFNIAFRAHHLIKSFILSH